MSSKRAPSGGLQAGEPLNVEVKGDEGEEESIAVQNDQADRRGFGPGDRLYYIAAIESDGVVRFNDWGYTTAEEARQALEGRLRAKANA